MSYRARYVSPPHASLDDGFSQAVLHFSRLSSPSGGPSPQKQSTIKTKAWEKIAGRPGKHAVGWVGTQGTGYDSSGGSCGRHVPIFNIPSNLPNISIKCFLPRVCKASSACGTKKRKTLLHLTAYPRMYSRTFCVYRAEHPGVALSAVVQAHLAWQGHASINNTPSGRDTSGSFMNSQCCSCHNAVTGRVRSWLLRKQWTRVIERQALGFVQTRHTQHRYE